MEKKEGGRGGSTSASVNLNAYQASEGGPA